MPKFSELSHEDRTRLEQQRAVVAAAAKQRYGTSNLTKTAADLSVLQPIDRRQGVQKDADVRTAESRHRVRGCVGDRTPVAMGDGDR